MIIVFMVCVVVELLVGVVGRTWDDWGGWKGMKRIWTEREGNDGEGSLFRFWEG